MVCENIGKEGPPMIRSDDFSWPVAFKIGKGADRFKTIEESNTFFEERKREFMNLPSSEAGAIVKVKTDIEGRYEDENVILSKENLVLPF